MTVVKKRGRVPKLDDTDLRILDMLYDDGRKSLVSIAEAVGLTHPSVKERLKRLIRSKLIKIQANINLSKLNLITSMISADISDPDELEELIENLKTCPRVISIMYSTGEYNIVLIILASDEKSVRAFVDRNIRTIKSLKKLYIANIDIICPKFIPIKLLPPEECYEKCKNCIFKTKLKICDGCEGLIEIIRAIKLR